MHRNAFWIRKHFDANISDKIVCLNDVSHRGPLPGHPVGLGGPGAELVEPQRGRAAGEKVVFEQPPALEALGSQALVVLTQKLDGIVVLAKTFVTVPLVPQPVGHACGTDLFLHRRGHLSGSCRMTVQRKYLPQLGIMLVFLSTNTAVVLTVSLTGDANGCEADL